MNGTSRLEKGINRLITGARRLIDGWGRGQGPRAAVGFGVLCVSLVPLSLSYWLGHVAAARFQPVGGLGLQRAPLRLRGFQRPQRLASFQRPLLRSGYKNARKLHRSLPSVVAIFNTGF